MAGEDPCQFGVAGDGGLGEDGGVFGIHAAGDVGGGSFAHGFAKGGGVLRHGDGVEVGEHEKTFIFVLQGHPVADSAEIIA